MSVRRARHTAAVTTGGGGATLEVAGGKGCKTSHVPIGAVVSQCDEHQTSGVCEGYIKRAKTSSLQPNVSVLLLSSRPLGGQKGRNECTL